MHTDGERRTGPCYKDDDHHDHVLAVLVHPPPKKKKILLHNKKRIGIEATLDLAAQGAALLLFRSAREERVVQKHVSISSSPFTKKR